MKKTVALILLLALTLAAQAAGASTTQGTVMLEGIAETVTLTLYESGLGYSLWVDMARFAPAQTGDTETFYPTAAGAADASLSVTLMRGEGSLKSAGRSAAALLVENGYKAEKADGSKLFPAYGALGYYGKQGDTRRECYVLETSRGYYMIVLQYPAEAAEGFGARMSAIAASFQAMP
jgi:hypothetical protein